MDTVYALKDEVQELRQVSPSQLFNLVMGSEESTVGKARPSVPTRASTEGRPFSVLQGQFGPP